MQTTAEYVELGTDWQKDKKIECCTTTPDTPPGCDCCYDSWTKELKTVTKDFSKITEQASQLSTQYSFITTRRDKFKSWYDDLTKLDDLAKSICYQFDCMLCQVEKICTNSSKAVDAIEILFCMIRDFYMEIDYIQTRYNQLINCIKCLNSSELAPGTGIMKCLDMYNDKLTAVIKTRDDLITEIMLAIEMAILLNSDICSPYGLEKVIADWQATLNCGVKCNDPGTTPTPPKPCKDNSTTQGGSGTTTDVCDLLPIVTFPICNDPYYLWVKSKYDSDVLLANQKAADLNTINKKKQALAACQDSLNSAIKEVNPKDRCK